MRARWLLLVLCAAACGPDDSEQVMITLPTDTVGAADTEDAVLAPDVDDVAAPPDTLDVATAEVHDVLDAAPPVDLLDPPDLEILADQPEPHDQLDVAPLDTPCVPDCDGKECGDDGCGGSCGVCVDLCDPCGTGREPPEDPSLCIEDEGICASPCCPLCCDDIGCGDDGCGGSCGVCDPPQLTSFSFLMLYNPDLEEDIELSIEGDTITGEVPLGVGIGDLVATFDYIGAAVLVGEASQVSGVTANDFGPVVEYAVVTNDGQEALYEVRASYYTGLPIMYVNTNGVPITSKINYIEGVASVFGGLNFPFTPFSYMEIRGRGHSTWGIHPKKPYQVKFGSKTEILGMPKEKRWILLANYSDKTMLRTRIGYEMGYMSNLEWTPGTYFAEVFLNNAYNGTYSITEKVEESDVRVAIGDDGYLLEIDATSHLKPGDIFFYSDHFLFRVEEPTLEAGSPELETIELYINEFEDVLMGPDFTDPVTGYPSYIDVDSFVDWYLVNEITKEVDSKSYSSIYLSWVPGELIKMGPLWDFDLSFGNVNYADSQYAEGWWIKQGAWYARLFEDPAFVELVQTRFAYYMDNKDYILDLIDYYASYLEMSAAENDAKWGSLGMYVWPNPVVYDTYQEEVDHLKAWYSQRMDWLDVELNAL